ncbi:outer membrane protein assembly factor BamB family protein [Paractinoplanes maris]|uniref:outer membrane protein assembly factor BamB family protein n=1 Tax=Paractinoplanes maris TaxID=1734446 RepID=UPI00202054F2|nr:PQQ-binding-like beta-propeller repeat protein [Actinoplanes maris]
MPTDLDDIFGSLGRQADVIPLGTAEQARLRGRERNRHGALIAAAAAVCLVLAGLGVLVRPQSRADHPVAPAPSAGPLSIVGSPIEFGRSIQETTPAVADGKVYTAWQAGDGKVTVVGADLHTGATEWKVTGMGFATPAVPYGVRAVKQGVMVAVDDQIYVYDPAHENANDWVLTVGDEDEVVPLEKALVRRWAINGQVDAHDWRTGRKLWTLEPPVDPAVRVIGVRTASDDPAGDSYTDGRVVVVTKTGKVQVLDAGSGELLRTITPTSPAQASSMFVASDGWLYEGGPSCCDTSAYRVSAIDLGTGQSSVVLTGKVGHELGGLDVCEPGRVCVLDVQDNALSSISAVDVAQRKKIWTVIGPPGAGSLSSANGTMLIGGGQTTDLLNANGETLFRSNATHVDWLDRERLLVLPITGAGDVSVLDIATRKLTQLGTIPQRTNMCAHTADRLACPTATDLRIYSLTG